MDTDNPWDHIDEYQNATMLLRSMHHMQPRTALICYTDKFEGDPVETLRRYINVNWGEKRSKQLFLAHLKSDPKRVFAYMYAAPRNFPHTRAPGRPLYTLSPYS